MIEASAAVSAQMQAAGTSSVSLGEIRPKPGTEADSLTGQEFREALSRVHDEIASKGGAGQDAGRAATVDPVAREASKILPSPWKTSLSPDAAGRANAAAGSQNPAAPAPGAATEANNVLQKSFDHAIAVTLISQVVGGFSQTTTTLIRQQ
jgi:hypothetical protein